MIHKVKKAVNVLSSNWEHKNRERVLKAEQNLLPGASRGRLAITKGKRKTIHAMSYSG